MFGLSQEEELMESFEVELRQTYACNHNALSKPQEVGQTTMHLSMSYLQFQRPLQAPGGNTQHAASQRLMHFCLVLQHRGHKGCMCDGEVVLFFCSGCRLCSSCKCGGEARPECYVVRRLISQAPCTSQTSTPASMPSLAVSPSACPTRPSRLSRKCCKVLVQVRCSQSFVPLQWGVEWIPALKCRCQLKGSLAISQVPRLIVMHR